MRRNVVALTDVFEDGAGPMSTGGARVGADAVMSRTFWSPRRANPRAHVSVVADLAAWRARRSQTRAPGEG